MQHGVRMGALSRGSAADREGSDSGLEPNSGFAWLQTDSPLGFSSAVLRKPFFPICNEAQISGSAHSHCLSGKTSQTFSLGPACSRG